ncbi:MAG: hypothetical protein WA637_06670 [Terriglobales bacterium]
MKGKKAGSSGQTADPTMAERTGVEQIVEKVVSQVLDSHVPQLREELVRRVMEQLPQATGVATASVSGEGGSANLLKAISAIQSGTTQREILRTLLDNAVRYSGRGALFVVKAGAATGWQGRGFDKEGDDTIKDFPLNVTTGVPEQALRSRMPFSGAARDIDPEFVAKFGAPADDQVLVLPLLLKEKVAALVYADAGADGGGKLDAAAVELLVLATSAWLEVASLRKQAQKEESAEAAGEKTESAAPPPSAPAHSDPFAAHAPKHVAPDPEPVPPSPAVVEQPVAVAQAEPVVTSAAAAPAPAADAFANLSPEDADVHRKAHRFARLLVDEIKLYNQVKVSEGRKNHDLYDRLKEDIEKSRITYQKRYGNTAAGGADYFSQELVRSLAEDDTSIMGANFRRN